MLGPDFFDRPAPVVARDLIGKYLVRRTNGNPSTGLRARTVALMITETEAYHGFEDKASHASRGQTLRNTPMYMEAGTIYVYFTYGMHWMLNLICGKKGFPSGVLIRGAGEFVGPARLTKGVDIDKMLNGASLGKKRGLWVEDRGVKIARGQILKTPRIGIGYAEEWIETPWRFVLKKPK